MKGLYNTIKKVSRKINQPEKDKEVKTITGKYINLGKAHRAKNSKAIIEQKNSKTTGPDSSIASIKEVLAKI